MHLFSNPFLPLSQQRNKVPRLRSRWDHDRQKDAIWGMHLQKSARRGIWDRDQKSFRDARTPPRAIYSLGNPDGVTRRNALGHADFGLFVVFHSDGQNVTDACAFRNNKPDAVPDRRRVLRRRDQPRCVAVPRPKNPDRYRRNRGESAGLPTIGRSRKSNQVVWGERRGQDKVHVARALHRNDQRVADPGGCRHSKLEVILAICSQ
mmetsp:Transcript_87090/g.244289  ORF Transcript_87090/g.244289 Transcript_87090/m.244289 type:complete len:206 (+) Transcript_87090:1819-2436(+)